MAQHVLLFNTTHKLLLQRLNNRATDISTN